MSSSPEVRASNVKTIVAVLDRDHPELAARLRRELPAALFERVEQRSAIAWLPLSDQIDIVEPVRGALSDAEFERLWDAHVRAMLGSRGMELTIQGLRRMLGTDLRSTLKIIARSWALISRDAGTMVVEDEGQGEGDDGENEHQAEIVLRGFPSALMRSGAFVRGYLISIRSMIAFAHPDAPAVTVELQTIDVDAGRAVYRIRW